MLWDQKAIKDLFSAEKLDTNKVSDACGQILRQQKLSTPKELAADGNKFDALMKDLSKERRHEVLKIGLASKKAEHGS